MFGGPLMVLTICGPFFSVSNVKLAKSVWPLQGPLHNHNSRFGRNTYLFAHDHTDVASLVSKVKLARCATEVLAALY